MGNFEKEKEEYLKELAENESIKKFTIKSYREDGMQEEERMFLDPQNETELKFAKAVLYSGVDMNNLVSCLFTGELEIMPFEENEMIIDLIKGIKSQKENGVIDPEILNDKTPEKKARLLVSRLMMKLYDKDELTEYVFKKAGFDSNKIMDHLKFGKYMMKFNAKYKTDDNPINNQKEYFDSEEGIDFLYRFVMESRKLCEKYAKRSDSYDGTDSILEDLYDLGFGR